MIEYLEGCECHCCRRMKQTDKLSMTYEEGVVAWNKLKPGVRKPTNIRWAEAKLKQSVLDRKDLLVWVDEIFKEAATPDILASTRSFFGGKPKGWKP